MSNYASCDEMDTGFPENVLAYGCVLSYTVTVNKWVKLDLLRSKRIKFSLQVDSVNVSSLVFFDYRIRTDRTNVKCTVSIES